MKYKIVLAILSLFFFIALASANLGTFNQNSCIDLKGNPNANNVTLTTITLPDGNTTYLNSAMTNHNGTFVYRLCNTALIGHYIYDYKDSNNQTYVNDFTIKKGGLLGIDFQTPIGITIFVVLFIISGCLMFFGLWDFGVIAFLINGFLILFSGVSYAIGFVIIGIGIVLLFMKGSSN
jgi:hypothetical protein